MPANRLSRETSPYLLQHAHNPVDWYPWGDEAFGKAAREDKPVFLSIGYSSCHWCHVMERESFENDEIARVLNERFVSIKVDREERPDVDDVYMTAVQLMTGRGGWPLTAFLLPDGRPFFTGTYFPPDDRHGRAGFRTILLRLSETYRERREDVLDTATRLADEIAGGARITDRQPPRPLGKELLEVLVPALYRAFDPIHGGFGSEPKFPPHLALEWMLDRAAAGDAQARTMAGATLHGMALGGIHDHLAGGFHRYSTDERWLVPHFEKMLYDNAQLLGVYAKAATVLADPFCERTARGIAEYLLSEMRGPEGGFYAATDADSEGEEGKYFVFSAAEVRDVLGESADEFMKAYRIEERGNFHDEATGRATKLNIPHLAKPLTAAEEARFRPMREALLARRVKRVPPQLDDKRLAGWNALAVSGFARAARFLHEPRYLEAARATARFLLETMRDEAGRLVRTWKNGEGKIPAFLEDEAYLANALLDLHESVQASPARGTPSGPEKSGSADPGWLDAARECVAGIRRRFRRRDGPGFTFSGEGHEELLVNGRDLFDKATPSASGSAAWAFLRLAVLDGDRALAAEARDALREVSGFMGRSPHGTESWYLALRELVLFEERHGALPEAVQPPLQVVSGDVTVEADPPPSLAPGQAADVSMRVVVAAGHELAEDRGLVVEAWAGSDVTVDAVTLPAQRAGRIPLTVRLRVAKSAARGERGLAVNARVRVCGDGVCLPEAVISLTIPLMIGG